MANIKPITELMLMPMLTVVPINMLKVVNAVKKRIGVSSVLNASKSKFDILNLSRCEVRSNHKR